MECLHLSRAKQVKWQCYLVPFLQHKQKMSYSTARWDWKQHLEQQCQGGKVFWQLMKMCYSQRLPFPQLQTASSSWNVWITSPFPLCSISGRVMEMWAFEQAELIYLRLLCFSQCLHPLWTSALCFIALLIESNAECLVTSSLSSTVRLQHYFSFLTGQLCQGKPESTTAGCAGEAGNCRWSR